jgi:hypothetical protein
LNYVESTEIHVAGNNISGGTSVGLTNTAGRVVQAEGNWWGSENGPSGVGPGTGESVSEGVIFAPWALSPLLDDAALGFLRGRSAARANRERAAANAALPETPISPVRPPITGDGGLR